MDKDPMASSPDGDDGSRGEFAQRFQYRCFDPLRQETLVGEMVMADAYAVRQALRAAGHEVLSVETIGRPLGQLTWWRQLLDRHWRTRRRPQRADLSDALATLLRAGLPLEQALGDLAAAPNRGRSERRMLHDLRDALRSGSSVADAIAEQAGWFDAVDRALLSAGQQAGHLDDAFEELSRLHHQAAGLGQKLVVALAYPSLLVFAGVAVVIFLSQAALPQLAAVLQESGQPVPGLTWAVMVTGDLLLHWGWLLGLGAGVVGAVLTNLWRRLPNTHALRALWQRTPWQKAVVRNRVAQITGTLARLLHSGLPLADALQAIAGASADRQLRLFAQEAVAAIKRGEDLSDHVAASALFDPESAQLLRLGEQSGDLATMAERVSQRARHAAHLALERLTALLEPTAIILLAGLIGLIVLAAVQPLIALTGQW